MLPRFSHAIPPPCVYTVYIMYILVRLFSHPFCKQPPDPLPCGSFGVCACLGSSCQSRNVCFAKHSAKIYTF